MRKILFALILCLMSITTFSQEWNTLKHDIKDCESINFNIEPFELQNLPTIDIKYVPYSVWDRYTFGNQLMTSGWSTLIIGSVITVVGGIIYGNGTKCADVNQLKTGTIFFGIGASLISVSIPLLCFGDNAKREANVDYEMFNLLYK